MINNSSLLFWLKSKKKYIIFGLFLIATLFFLVKTIGDKVFDKSHAAPVPTPIGAQVDVYIGGIKKNTTPYWLGPLANLSNRYGINGGPVKVVSTNFDPILTSQRAFYGDSFNSIVGIPANQLTTEYWFTSLDDLGMITYLVIGNPSTTQTATVDVYIGGVKKNTTPYTIAPGQRVYPRYGINGGPVRVVSTNGVPIFTSERSKFGTSFNEVLGFPADQLTTDYVFTSLNDADMITYLVIGNPSTTQTATVDVYLNGAKKNTTPYTIAPGQRVYPRYGINAGPVRVVSTNGVPIFTSERIKYGTSFNEVLGFPTSKLTNDYWFTTVRDVGYVFDQYNNPGMRTYLTISNPSTTASTKIDIYVAGNKMNANPISIAPGFSYIASYVLDAGPVRVVGVPGTSFLVSEKVIYQKSYNEIVGFPANQLTTEYWFTTLDDVGMSTDLVISNPQ